LEPFELFIIKFFVIFINEYLIFKINYICRLENKICFINIIFIFDKMNIFKFFKKTPKKNVSVENLPDLVRKISKNELIDYKAIEIKQKSKKDPLYMRVQPDEIDYIYEYNKQLTVSRKYLYNPLKFFLAKYFKSLKYEKEIHRPNVELRESYFNEERPDKFKISFEMALALISFFSFFIGYWWSRLKYDIYTRKWMYTYVFSYMMAFEFLDYQANLFLDKINDLVPIEMSNKELEFILYKNLRTYLIKRKIENEVKGIIETDPQLYEIDNLVKKIN
jgi:hypothetical protein